MVARYSLVLDGAAIKELPVGDTLAGQATSGANADITSLTGLTTALSANQGGTGLTSAGTAGNVLTSTGSGWSSGAAPSSNGGATTTSSAVDITLTAASNRVQAVTMTAASLSVTLPVATTLTTGGALFVIKNYGTNTFAVRNSAGLLLAPVAGGQIVGLYLSDNTTAAGVWAVGNESTASFLSEILNGSTLAVNSIATGATSICALSATQAVVAYITSANTMRARTINISGATITLGAELLIGSGYYGAPNVIAMSATQALVVGYTNICYTLNISGTTITAGTGVDAGADGSYRALAKLSSTRAIMAYHSGANFVVRTLDISGTTITLNPEYSGAATDGSYIAIAAFSATAVVIAWTNASSYLITQCWTITGVSVSPSNNTQSSSVSTQYVTACPLTSTTAIAIYFASNTIRACVINFDGTNVATRGVESNTGIYGQWVVSAAISPTKVIVGYTGSSVLQNVMLTVSGGVVTAAAPLVLNSFQGNNGSIASLSTGASIMAFVNQTTTFANTTLIETAL